MTARCCMLFCLALLLSAAAGRADQPSTQPAIVTTYEARRDPPMRLWVTRVNLADPRIRVCVARAGDDPDGDGPWQTTLLPTTDIAKREKFDLTVNASFFAARGTKDIEGIFSRYRPGIWAAAVGWTISDGSQWSRRESDWPVFWIDDHAVAHIAYTNAIGPGARQMVAGNAWFIRDGEDRIAQTGVMTQRHPRTAVGISRDGTELILLVVDGRQLGKSIGMTEAELAAEMHRLGAWNALNLDGGGSTTLVQRDAATGEQKILNSPSDGRERAVADVIGVRFAGD